MDAQCRQKSFAFHNVGNRQVVARFDGEHITSDAGSLFLREVERLTGIIAQLVACFTDHRDPKFIEHALYTLIAQRIFALCLGYEDQNDHDMLRHDPMLAMLVGLSDPLGEQRVREADRGKALAGKSTINRMELTPAGASEANRYKKIVASCEAIDRLLVNLLLQAHENPPEQIILDIDATDDPLHGDQLGKFYHGYYGHYCYLPLYVTCGDFVLAAKLRPSNIDAAKGTLPVVPRIVEQIRETWPNVRILLRGDSGFCREPIMRWCEENNVDFVFGLAQNKRLNRSIGKQLHEADQQFQATGEAARVFTQLQYRTQKSWSRSRRVVAKAEHLSKGANPRFVVTSLPEDEVDARELYEKVYCARGDMENRIKEQQLDLFADRTSAHTMRANQIRLYFSTIAYSLMAALRRLGLKETEMAHAQASTIRTKVLKIGARIRITTRKVWVSLSEAYPFQSLFAKIWSNLQPIPT